MVRTVLRRLLQVGFAGVLAAVFVYSSYLSFNAFVRRGEIIVPEVVGLELEDATAAVERSGLAMVRREGGDRHDQEVPAGAVVRQRPRGGSSVKRGSEIELRLSLGPERIEVPDLSGQTLQAARLNLRAAGLQVGALARVYAEGAREERVVRQDPPAGGRADHAATVDLYLGLEDSSDSYVMPELVYERYDGVRAFFEERGFRVGSVKFEPYEGIESGVVLRQFPLPGHRLGREDVISLVVSSLPDGAVPEDIR